MILKRLLRDQSGATAVEYGLIVALIFLAMMLGVRGFVGAAADLYTTIANSISAVVSGPAA